MMNNHNHQGTASLTDSGQSELSGSALPLPSSQVDENLNAYSPTGSYGRLATEFARRRLVQIKNGHRAPPSSAAATDPIDGRPGPNSVQDTAHEGEANAEQEARHSQAPFWPRAGQSRSLADSGDDGARAATDEPEAGAIYRDRVYHFDGISRALAVPRAVYASVLPDSLSSPAALGERPNNKHHESGYQRLQRARGFSPFGQRHTVSFWMRHAPFKFRPRLRPGDPSGTGPDDLAELGRHVREHLVCSTSGSAANNEQQMEQQHPYALFVRNCRLVLSIDGGPSGGQPQFSATNETATRRLKAARHVWRWMPDANQACDNKWHLYTINVDWPARADLFVDGRQLELEWGSSMAGRHSAPAHSQGHPSPELADPTGQLTLGACWDPARRTMTGHFRGALSGLSVVPDANEEPHVAECLGRCTEALVSATPLNDQQHQQVTSGRAKSQASSAGPRQQASPADNSLVSYQESQSSIKLNGHNFLDVEDALAQIAYVNRRPLPSVGRRLIRVETLLECQPQQSNDFNGSKFLIGQQRVESFNIELDVLPSLSLPVISIEMRSPKLARDYSSLVHGVAPFESVSIRVKRLNLLAAANPPGSLASSTDRASGLHHPGAGLASTVNTDADYIEDNADESPEVGYGGHQSAEQIEPVEDLSTIRHKLETCSIRVQPPLDSTHERLVLPLDELDKLGLYWRQSKDGAMIYGLDSAENYGRLLKRVLYQNQRSALYSERRFKLLCSDLNGRLVSNGRVQTIAVIHPDTDELGKREQQPMEVLADDGSRAADSLLRAPEVQITAADYEDNLTTGSGARREPAAKLNRLAVAFLVFMVSMVIIVLVVALANLRYSGKGDGQNIVHQRLVFKCKHRRRKNAKRRHRCSTDDEELAPAHHYHSGVRELSNDEEEDEENDENHVRELYDRYDDDDDLVVVGDDDERLSCTSLEPPHLLERRHQLLSDEEFVAQNDSGSTIVMNPIFHSRLGETTATTSEKSSSIDSGRHLEQIRLRKRTLVADQRPGAHDDSMRAPARTLTHAPVPNSGWLTGSRLVNLIAGWAAFHRADGVDDSIPLDEDDCEGEGDDGDDADSICSLRSCQSYKSGSFQSFSCDEQQQEQETASPPFYCDHSSHYHVMPTNKNEEVVNVEDDEDEDDEREDFRSECSTEPGAHGGLIHRGSNHMCLKQERSSASMINLYSSIDYGHYRYMNDVASKAIRATEAMGQRKPEVDNELDAGHHDEHRCAPSHSMLCLKNEKSSKSSCRLSTSHIEHKFRDI